MVVHRPRRPVVSVAVAVVLWVIGVTDCKISQATRRQSIQPMYYSTYLDTTICRTIPGLTKSQIELCYRQPDTTLVALQGLSQAVKECQSQFREHRWNCSSLSTRGQNPYISVILQKGYKESAFAHSIASAGVVISVARSCSSGLLLNCGCDSKTYKMRKPRATPRSRTELQTAWKWGGCSHNLRYGIKFSKMFLDARERAEDIHSKINLHNNQVGRMAVSNNMQVMCKCHGISGSCGLKTCWRATPSIQVVGKTLKERFRSAILVDQTNLGKKSLRKFNVINQKRRQHARLNQWTPRKNKRKRDLSFDLLYYQKSPNFCEKDPFLDVQGTAGRLCNRTSSGPSSCSNLCCGRGYDLVKQKRVERCNCKFLWCCQVECQTCSIEEWISVCK